MLAGACCQHPGSRRHTSTCAELSLPSRMCVPPLQDPDLRELRDSREWLDMLSTVRGGMTREQKVNLRAEAKVSGAVCGGGCCLRILHWLAGSSCKQGGQHSVDEHPASSQSTQTPRRKPSSLRPAPRPVCLIPAQHPAGAVPLCAHHHPGRPCSRGCARPGCDSGPPRTQPQGRA